MTYLSLASIFYASGNLSEGLENFQKGFEILCKTTKKEPSLILRNLRRILAVLKQVNISSTTEAVVEKICPYFIQLLGQEDTLTIELLDFKEKLHAKFFLSFKLHGSC